MHCVYWYHLSVLHMFRYCIFNLLSSYSAIPSVGVRAPYTSVWTLDYTFWLKSTTKICSAWLVLRPFEPWHLSAGPLWPYWPGNDLDVSIVLAPPLCVVAVNCSPIVDDGLRVTQKKRYSQLNSSVDRSLSEHEFCFVVQCYGRHNSWLIFTTADSTKVL